MKGKEIVDILAGKGFSVTAQKSLDAPEFDALFDTLTRQNQINGIEDYLDGITYIPSSKKATVKAEDKSSPESVKAEPAEDTVNKPTAEATDAPVHSTKTEPQKSEKRPNRRQKNLSRQISQYRRQRIQKPQIRRRPNPKIQKPQSRQNRQKSRQRQVPLPIPHLHLRQKRRFLSRLFSRKQLRRGQATPRIHPDSRNREILCQNSRNNRVEMPVSQDRSRAELQQDRNRTDMRPDLSRITEALRRDSLSRTDMRPDLSRITADLRRDSLSRADFHQDPSSRALAALRAAVRATDTADGLQTEDMVSNGSPSTAAEISSATRIRRESVSEGLRIPLSRNR